MDFSNAKHVFHGNRLMLRVLEENDATQHYADWLTDPEVNRYLATKSATIPQLRDYIAKKNLQSDALFFGMFLNDGEKHIGTIKLEPIDIPGKKATIAIMIGDKTCWGKGYGPEAMQLLIDWCFSTLGMDEVNLGLIAKNASAMQAYKKLGFEEYQREKGYVRYGDELHDQVWMALRRPEALLFLGGHVSIQPYEAMFEMRDSRDPRHDHLR
jgi:RimJ/RimL family protein N-acetyltransferase